MKKSLFITACSAFIICTANAQVIQKTLPAVKQNVIIKTVPVAPPPPPPAANKSAGTSNQNTPVYSLTAVRVNIKTGSDNKEFPSKVYVTLMLKTNPNYYIYVQNNLNNEMRINSDTEFGLERHNEGTPERITLEALQTAGLILQIYYDPNLFTDAWKIESISMVLEFKDQNGNLHPSLGRKTVVFSNAYGFLNAGVHYMQCITDQSFTPLTATIK